MPSTESVNNFISEVLTWIDSHDYIEGGDNTYTSGSGDISVTIHSKGVSSQTVLPVFSDTGRWQMVFTAERDVLTSEAVNEVVQQVTIERDVMFWLVKSLRSHGWRVSGADANGGYLAAERDNGRIHIRVHCGIIDRSIRIEGNGSVTLQDSIKTQGSGRISNVGAFAGAFGTTIEDVRFSEWKKGIYRFWLWNKVQREIVEFYYHCED